MHRSRPGVGFGLERVLLTGVAGGDHSRCDGVEVEQHLPALKKKQGGSSEEGSWGGGTAAAKCIKVLARGLTCRSLRFHRVMTLFRPTFQGSDWSTPCADFRGGATSKVGRLEPLVGLLGSHLREEGFLDYD
jgi:hypothetical protein